MREEQRGQIKDSTVTGRNSAMQSFVKKRFSILPGKAFERGISGIGLSRQESIADMNSNTTSNLKMSKLNKQDSLSDLNMQQMQSNLDSQRKASFNLSQNLSSIK